MGLLVIAHRGNQERFPENTVPAFVSAFKDCDANGIELDVHRTEDWKLVVFHDDWLARLSGEPTSVKHLTYEELKEKSVKAFKAKGFEGLYIPTLEEVLERVKEFSRTVVIEIKKGEKSYPKIAECVGSVIRDLGMEDMCMVTSFDLATVKEIAEKFPEIRRAYLPRIFEFKYLMGICDKLGLHSLHLPASPEGLEVGKKLAENGKDVFFYVVNDERLLKKCVDAGADGIFTDYPCLIKKLITESAGTGSG